jgi:uncharacterized protein YjiS (DUF1127 family)
MAVFDTNTHTRRHARHPNPKPTWMQRLNVWRTRRALAQLDADALKDIGLSREDARREADKLFWDVPVTWIQK